MFCSQPGEMFKVLCAKLGAVFEPSLSFGVGTPCSHNSVTLVRFVALEEVNATVFHGA